jgi:histidinol-phosphate/aromatic aminotransferase/cobyric acid decarboxylase-like protein
MSIEMARRTSTPHDLEAIIAGSSEVSDAMVLTFGDRTSFLADLLTVLGKSVGRLVSVGLFTADVAIAADRANVSLVETTGDSPFSGDVDRALACVESDSDLIYVANPNRVSGAGYSLADLRTLARAVPEGALIVDEHYYDCAGVNGRALLDTEANVYVLRSFSIALGSRSTDAGYILASEIKMHNVRESVYVPSMSPVTHEALLEISGNEELATLRVTELHSESLRLATELTGLGVQCRLTNTDFLLLRVASPKDAGNFLSRCKIPVENLDGYPMMKRYMRYYIGSPDANDRLLAAFRRMPIQYYRLVTIDRRAIVMKRKGERVHRIYQDVSSTRIGDGRPQGIRFGESESSLRTAKGI